MTIEPKERLLLDWGLKVANFKCFGESPQGFDQIKKINVLIGQNNVGKSTLLEVIEAVINGQKLSGRKGKATEIHLLFDGAAVPESLSPPVPKAEKLTFYMHDITASDGLRPTENFGERMSAMLKEYTLLHAKPDEDFTDNERSRYAMLTEYLSKSRVFFDDLRTLVPFSKCRVIKIGAGRRLIQDNRSDNFAGMLVQGLGAAVNQAIHALSHRSENNKRSQVQIRLRNELNRILEQEDFVDEISTVEIANTNVEITLGSHSEEREGYINISKCGTGVGMVIQVLLSTLLLPGELGESGINPQSPLGDGKSANVFLLEELENSIHPATLRRMFRFISEQAQDPRNYFFLTTHSPVAIDFFIQDPNAQIVHLRKRGGISTVVPVTDFDKGKSVIDDLGHRASDVLQSNCVIWVEGPSDVIYINRWIDVWSDGRLVEGIHYQCMFYGGATSAHMSAVEKKKFKSEKFVISLSKINPHVIFIADRDTDDPNRISCPHVRRIVKEIKETGNGVTWVTDGRAIENYLTDEILQLMFAKEIERSNLSLSALGKYDDVRGMLSGHQLTNEKITLARLSVPHWDRDIMSRSLDLANQMEQIVSYIKTCNQVR